MSHLIALIVGVFIGYIIKPSKKQKTTPFTPSPAPPKSKTHTGIDFERVQELRSRKIERKYLFPKKELEDQSHFFYGKKIVITGEYDSFPDRNDLAKLFWDVGADIDTGIGKNTDFLITGSDYGPVKMKKAIEQNITIIDQDNLFDYFEL